MSRGLTWSFKSGSPSETDPKLIWNWPEADLKLNINFLKPIRSCSKADPKLRDPKSRHGEGRIENKFSIKLADKIAYWKVIHYMIQIDPTIQELDSTKISIVHEYDGKHTRLRSCIFQGIHDFCTEAVHYPHHTLEWYAPLDPWIYFLPHCNECCIL